MTRRDLPLEHGQPVTGGVLGRQRLLFRRDRLRVGPAREGPIAQDEALAKIVEALAAKLNGNGQR